MRAGHCGGWFGGGEGIGGGRGGGGGRGEGGTEKPIVQSHGEMWKGSNCLVVAAEEV